MSKNDASALTKWFVLLTLFLANGRGGEVAFCTYDSMFWDEDAEEVWTNWNQMN